MLDNKFEFYDLSLKMKCMKFREIFLRFGYKQIHSGFGFWSSHVLKCKFVK